MRRRARTPAPTDRRRAIELLESRLRRHGVARLQMAAIVLGTGLAGLLFSAGLYAAGLSSMTVRYGLAILGAYGVFLMLVRGWVGLYRNRLGPDALDWADLGSNFVDLGGIGGASPIGGSSGGAGASGTWSVPSYPIAVPSQPAGAPAGMDLGGDSGIGDLLDLDDGWVVAVPVVIAIGGLLSAIAIVWTAPALLAEIAIDLALASGLYRRLSHLDRGSWLKTAMRATWFPIAFTAVLLIGGAAILEFQFPGAETIGQVLARLAG